MTEYSTCLQSRVIDIARKDIAKLHYDNTVQQALDDIREKGLGDRIIYFYVVNDNDQLVGVVPTRRLLTSPLNMQISEVMIDRVITIPQHATVLETHDFFIQHKFLAFPIVDENRHILGVVDIEMLTDDAFDIADKISVDTAFEMIGFRITQVRESSILQAFRFRFPWLLATITSGTICALLVGVYEITLAKSLILAFFLTLVLGLGESVSIQSMTTTIYNLRSIQPGWAWYVRTLRREIGTAISLGFMCGLVVGLIALLWRGEEVAAFAIGSSIMLTLSTASFFGLSIPTLMHKLKLDVKIASGPLTLALTDISTILIYFSLAKMLL